MNSKLSIISYNCRSVNSNAVIISDLLKKCLFVVRVSLYDRPFSHKLPPSRVLTHWVPSHVTVTSLQHGLALYVNAMAVYADNKL